MNSAAELQIDNFLRTLRECLPGMSVADREEIVREISTHIRECSQEPSSNVDSILERLGSAESLASQYGQDLLIRRASRSISPLLILRGTLQLAKHGMQGIVLFLSALFGYGLGAGLVLTASLKPIFPNRTGLWVGPGVFDFGIHEPRYSDPVHEVLGWWYIPIGLCLGFLLLWLTTYGVRKFFRRFRQRDPVFVSRQMSIQTKVGSFILLASFLAIALGVSSAPRSSARSDLSSRTQICVRGSSPIV